MSTPASPTTFSPALSQAFNAKVYLKPEIHGATKSYKDRIGPAAISEAIRAGATKVVVTFMKRSYNIYSPPPGLRVSA